MSWKLYAVLAALGFVVALSGCAAVKKDGSPVGKMDGAIPIPAAARSECRWNHVDEMSPSQFLKAPHDFTEFRTGWHRLAFCPEGTLDVNVLEYDDPEEARKAVDALLRSIPLNSPAVELSDSCAGEGLRMFKVEEMGGGELYVTVWREGSKLNFVEEETTPKYPGDPLKRIRSFLEEYACR